MRKDCIKAYKQGQKDMLKSILGTMAITAMLMVMFAKMFMLF